MKKIIKPEEIKSFPSEAVDRYLKFYGHLPCERKKIMEIVEKIKQMRKDSDLARIDKMLEAYEEGYNQALDDILKVLNKK